MHILGHIQRQYDGDLELKGAEREEVHDCMSLWVAFSQAKDHFSWNTNQILIKKRNLKPNRNLVLAQLYGIQYVSR